MTDEQLTNIEQLAARATPPPWRAITGIRPNVISLDADGSPHNICQASLSADAAFIAAFREWVPEALAEIRRLRAALESKAAD